MYKYRTILALLPVALLTASCGQNSTTLPGSSVLPPPTNNGAVPAAIVATSGFKVSVFAASTTSTKPDSIQQIGRHVFIAYGDTVNPDGTAGPSGVTQTEVIQYDLSGKLQKTYEVPGHNDGLMKFDNDTLWTMSNEDANPKLTIITISSGAEKTYVAQPSLLNATGGLPHGGGIDDMQLINGKVYVSASNPTVDPAATCAPNSSTPGCPNGVTTGPFVYTLTLNGDGSTFDLATVVSSNVPATNIATGAAGTFNITDTDSESVAPDGTTLVVDGQQDAELAFVTGLGATPVVTYLPLTLNGSPQQVDDTRYVPSGQTALLLADTPSNAAYRIDGGFTAGQTYSAAQTSLVKLDPSSGAMTSIVSGFGAPHGLAFITPQ